MTEHEWTAHGLPCHVVLVDRGVSLISVVPYRNGYAGVPNDHPWHGVSYHDRIGGKAPEDVIDVHGGVTYSGAGFSGDASGAWFFGFDTAHYDSGEWTLEQAIAETERMAEQLAAITVR